MRRSIWFVAALLLFMLSRLAAAQIPTQALSAIRGFVRDDDNKAIVHATITIDNVATGIFSGNDGAFTLSNIKPGRHIFGVRAVGYVAANQVLDFVSGKTIDADIVLPRMTALETRKVIGMSAARAEFEERRSRKLGYAVDSTVLNNGADLQSALSRVPLTRVQSKGLGLSISVRTLSSRGACSPAAFLDGLPTRMDIVTSLPANNFRAIEVIPYEMVPGKYSRGPCVGAILFWSKNAKW